MIVFPNAKINLGLNIVSKREDGYHNLETVFYPVKTCDILEMVPADDGLTRIDVTGLPVPGKDEDNLAIKAWRIMHEDYRVPPVHIHLHKVIPTGAGLGGGSSDGAFAIVLLNDMFRLELLPAEMERIALRLGSDCPFFIRNRSAYATGRGEMLEDFQVDLSEYTVSLVFPEIHVDTKTAFSLICPRKPELGVREILNSPVREWKGLLVNDFEEPVFKIFPQLRKIKEELYDSGAVYASMTGSGSAFYGIYPNR